MEKKETPNFPNAQDCPFCEFQGTAVITTDGKTHKNIDLYLCRSKHPTIIVRYGVEPHEYYSFDNYLFSSKAVGYIENSENRIIPMESGEAGFSAYGIACLYFDKFFKIEVKLREKEIADSDQEFSDLFS